MKIDNKKILIGLSILAVGTAIYFLLKNKRNKNQVGILDDENIEFDYNNASGKTVSTGIATGIETPLSISNYNSSLEKAYNDKKYQNYIGKKIYTFVDNVNIRMGANVNNGIFHNIAGKIPKKKTFIGKVVTVKLGNDKKLWFAVNEENSNKLYDVKKNFNWSVTLNVDPSLRWFRSDVVIINMNK